MKKIIPFTHHGYAISTLVTLLQDPQLSNLQHYGVAEQLGEISVSNPQATAALVTLLQNSQLSDRLRYDVAKVLDKISVGNPRAIANLETLLQDPQLSDWQRYRVAEQLGEISVSNPQAIAALVTLLQDPWPAFGLGETLGKILVRVTMPSVIWQLKNNISDKTCIDNFILPNPCFGVLLRCAETLSYQEFYTAWYPLHPN